MQWRDGMQSAHTTLSTACTPRLYRYAHPVPMYWYPLLYTGCTHPPYQGPPASIARGLTGPRALGPCMLTRTHGPIEVDTGCIWGIAILP